MLFENGAGDGKFQSEQTPPPHVKKLLLKMICVRKYDKMQENIIAFLQNPGHDIKKRNCSLE